jgi:formylglycine-generating enzyme required for sulfatase activity
VKNIPIFIATARKLLIAAAWAWILGMPEAESQVRTHKAIAEIYANSIGMEFVSIPAGTSIMGSPDSEANAFEKP